MCEMAKERFSIKKRLKSFKYAFSGLRVLIEEEHNARIHLLAAVCVIAAGLLLRITLHEWLAVAFAIGLVFCMEILNTCVENISDFVCPEKDGRIKRIKDLAAAAVFVSAITAAVTGLCVFLPKIIAWFR